MVRQPAAACRALAFRRAAARTAAPAATRPRPASADRAARPPAPLRRSLSASSTRELGFVARQQQRRVRCATGQCERPRQRWHSSGTSPVELDRQRRPARRVGRALDAPGDRRRRRRPARSATRGSAPRRRVPSSDRRARAPAGRHRSRPLGSLRSPTASCGSRGPRASPRCRERADRRPSANIG